MKIRIEIDCDNAAFEHDTIGEVERILRGIGPKLRDQMGRAPGCLCTAPESADKLKDRNGNTVGTLTIIH